MSLAASRSVLLLIDLQQRLMPAIAEGAAVVANARRLAEAARLLDVPVLATEQNPAGLGQTVPEVAELAPRMLSKRHFDATREEAFEGVLPPDRPEIVVAGCETHVCVSQTALGLLDAGRRVYLVRDAVGSRRSESKEAAIRRLERHGAEIVTTEMVVFEWLGSAADPRRREAIALIK